MRSRTAITGSKARPAGITLVEMVVVIAILALLFGAVVVTSRQVASSRAQATARQQLALIAAAIDRYVSAWPRWTVAGVVIADKGWPDAFPGRLFAAAPNGPYDTIAGFNDYFDFDRNNADHVRNAASSLAYALMATSGRGPYVSDPQQVNMQQLGQFDTTATNAWYPTTGGGRRAREILVDPWGTPIRYFWVYRDTTPAPNKALHGLLAVNYGPFMGGNLPGGLSYDGGSDIDFVQPDGSLKVAVGYVLESAGADRKFGDTWKANPSGQEIADAADNVRVLP